MSTIVDGAFSPQAVQIVREGYQMPTLVGEQSTLELASYERVIKCLLC